MSTKHRALVPVSLFNRRSTSAEALVSLAQLTESYDEVIVFLADRIQIYNNARKDGLDGLRLRPFDIGVEEFCDQAREIPQKSKLTFCDVDSIADGQFFMIYRRLLILRHLDTRLGDDIDDAAAGFCRARGLDTKIAHALSAAYILEEMALNLRLRVSGEIEAEFYMGGTLPKPLLDLYAGKYLADVFALTDSPSLAMTFSFFEVLAVPGQAGWLSRASS